MNAGIVLILAALWGLQLYISYLAWKTLPSGAGLPPSYGKSRMLAIGLGIIPPNCGSFVIQIPVFFYAKFQAKSLVGGADLLKSAPTSFSSAPSTPTPTPPAPAGGNPFGSGSSSAPPPPAPASNPFGATAAPPPAPASNPFGATAAPPAPPVADAGESPAPPPPSTDNPFL
jgi:hypothetical protein